MTPNLVLLVVGGWLLSRNTAGIENFHRYIKRYSRRALAVVLVVGYAFVFGLFLPTSYNISDFPPGRALVIPHTVMVLLVLGWGTIMAISLRKSSRDTGQISKVLLLLIIALLFVGPIVSAWNTMRLIPEFQVFSSEWDARDRVIRQGQLDNEASIVVSPFSVDLAHYVLVSTVEEGYVTCLQDYYRIQELVIQEDNKT